MFEDNVKITKNNPLQFKQLSRDEQYFEEVGTKGELPAHFLFEKISSEKYLQS